MARCGHSIHLLPSGRHGILSYGQIPEHDWMNPSIRALAFNLIEAAQDRWRAVNAPHLVALVRAGATFINGKLIERPGQDAQLEAV